MELNAKLNIILLGKKGAGKSSSGNTILGQQAFESKKGYTSVNRHVAVESGTIDGIPVIVYDTPGIFDPELSEEEIQQMINEKVLKKCDSGRSVFLLVIKADSFTEEERKTVERIEKLLGEQFLQKTWILFTRGDKLEDENVTIQEFLERNKSLEEIVQKYDQRYHVFNNKKKEPSAQARLLLAKIMEVNESEEWRMPRLIPDIRNSAPGEKGSPDSSRRIVLLGKTGSGKSAAGNTILGQKEFKSSLSSNSVTSKCLEKNASVSGRSVSVVDTPGFFDTKIKPEELAKEIARSVYISSPGPHAVLIVLRVDDRFTEHEQQIPQQIESLFGQGVLKYSIILFTRGDMLEEETIEDIIKENSKLRHLVQQCGGRFHVFSNKNQNNREQVNDLLKKIDTMIEQNEGGHYSNRMFEDAQRFRQEERERRQREEERTKVVEKLRQEEIERLTQEIRAEYDQRTQGETEIMINKVKELKALGELEELDLESELEFQQFFKQYEERFTFASFVVRGGAIGSMFGAIIGVIGGPVGVVVGAALGAAVGAAAGTVANLIDVLTE